MAELAKSFVTFSNKSVVPVFTAATGSDYIDYSDCHDQRTFLMLKNADAANDMTFTFKAGGGMLSAAGDLAITVVKGTTLFVPMSRVDSARVKVLDGTDKGKILVTEAGTTIGDLTIAVVTIE